MSFTRALARALANHSDPTSLRARLRRKRIAPLLDMIAAVHARKGRVTIIDIGGTEKYWQIIPDDFLTAHQVTITVVNVPGSTLPADHGRFHFIVGDGCDLSAFADNAFDIVHSNSVIEHVGDWSRMVLFAGELARIAGRQFVQTPNFWFPLEPHCMTPFFHWLPKPVRVWMVMRFQLGHWPRAKTVDEAVRSVESARLLDRNMFQALFPSATVSTERFWGLPKSFIAVRQAGPE